MHLLDCYSLNCGLKIGKPFILEKFFPLNIDKFITFEPEGMFPSTQYDYWDDVLDILEPILSEHDIKILQIGSNASNFKFSKVYNVSGQASTNQQAYLINKSILHLGTDGFSNHVASHYGKKIVSLFSDSPPSNNGPLFSRQEDLSLIIPDLKGKKHSYSVEEKDKTINTIKPEQIAQEVCSLIDVPFNYNFETVSMGSKYNDRSVELIPDGEAVDPSNLSVDSLIMRMDLSHNEISLAKQLQVCPCNIITCKPISLHLLKAFQARIAQFVYVIGDNDSKQFVEELFSMGIQCLLMSEKEGEELEKLKFKYLDYGKIHSRNLTKKEDLNFLKNEDLNNLYFRSNKYLIHDGQVFNSLASFENGNNSLELGSRQFQKVIESESFWKEADNFMFVRKN